MTWDHFEINRLDQAQDYVCTFEQAKKLYELGITKKSLFYYSKITGAEKFLGQRFTLEAYYNHIPGINKMFPICGEGFCECYSAFTSQELAELISIYKQEWMLAIRTVDSEKQFGFNSIDALTREHDIVIPYTLAKNEAHVLAYILIYLLESKK